MVLPFAMKVLLPILLLLSGIAAAEATFESCHKENGSLIHPKICLPADYMKSDLPPNVPINVEVGVFVKGIIKVDEQAYTVSVSLHIYMFWQDSRIEVDWNDNDTFYLHYDTLQEVWYPDLYFYQLVDFYMSKALIQQCTFTIQKQENLNKLGFLTEAIVTISCAMNFKTFPVDTQKCELKMTSTSYPIHVSIKIFIPYQIK
jgi:hypothetical protein